MFMTARKYDKYFTTDVAKPNPKDGGASITSTRHLDDFGGGHFSIDCIYLSSPRLMITQPHQHEFPQYLHFFSTNPDDSSDFDAEIEITLGEEAEKHIITQPTAVYIPAKTLHGPLNFARITKPVLFVDIAVTGKYSRIGDTPD
jgi:hypothetical protein